MLPGCALVAVFAPLGGRLLDRAGARLPIITGMACLVASVVLYVAFSSALTPFMFGGFYVLFGIGQGLGFSTTMTNGLGVLPESIRTDGNSVFNTFQQLGGSIGVSAVTAVVGAFQGASQNIVVSTVEGGYWAFVLLAAVVALAALCSVLVLFVFSRKGRA